MAAYTPRYIDVDWANFDPWRVQPVRHTVMHHPLLDPQKLVELGKRLDVDGRVRTHSNTAEAGTPFDSAPRLHPNTVSVAETLQSIQAANAWMSLLNVQTDPLYQTLVREVLDDVRPMVEQKDPGMCYRAGWIFVSSPKTVTPFHMDTEHNFILQMRGLKTVYVWEHDDTEVVSELARDRFHGHHSRDLMQWREDFRKRARVFHLQPGQGAYMPSTSPHLVENGDEPSITVSFTYYTDSTRRNRLLHKCHAKMRSYGLDPSPVGKNEMLDSITYAGARLYKGASHLRQRLRGQPSFPDHVEFAYAQIGV